MVIKEAINLKVEIIPNSKTIRRLEVILRKDIILKLDTILKEEFIPNFDTMVSVVIKIILEEEHLNLSHSFLNSTYLFLKNN